ncbi:MAG: MMPL family transporter, partial [Candidatus Sumerlaeota bacterium]|nr:MMPL family transporter [Candidatus Sumerlaeota bacterium]
LVLMLLLFIVVFRKVEAIFYVLLPVAFGIDWTLGLAGMLYAQVTAATLIFVFVAIALGFEFCLHIYNRFLDELYRTLDYPRALEVAFVRTGRGILTSALTGATLFGTLRLTPFEGLRELGTVAAFGVLCGMLSTFTVLPVMISFKARQRQGRARHLELPRLGLDRLAAVVANYPAATLALGFLLTSYFAYWTLQLHHRETPPPYVPPSEQPVMNTDYYRPYPDAKEMPTPSHPVLALVSAEGLQDALERNDRLFRNLLELKEEYHLISIDSLRRVLPSVATQTEFRRQARAIDVPALAGRLAQAAARHGMPAEMFAPIVDLVRRAQALPEDADFLQLEGQTATDMRFGAAVRRYLLAEPSRKSESGLSRYTVVTAIYPTPESFGGDGLTRFLKEAARGVGGVRFTGDALMGHEMAPGVRKVVARVALAALAILVLAMGLHFRSARKALWTTAPVVAVMIWVFGALALLDIHLHFYTLMLLPLIAIFAIDHNLHFLHRYDEKQDMGHSLTVVGRAMLTTSLAIAVGFGGLAFANYAGFRHLGLLMIFGNAFAFLGSATLLPAAVRLREWRKGRGNGEAVEEEWEGAFEDV